MYQQLLITKLYHSLLPQMESELLEGKTIKTCHRKQLSSLLPNTIKLSINKGCFEKRGTGPRMGLVDLTAKPLVK